MISKTPPKKKFQLSTFTSALIKNKKIHLCPIVADHVAFVGPHQRAGRELQPGIHSPQRRNYLTVSYIRKQ
ncbi:uncharacterized protein G2W53_020363 [Senna tora]|uniref:Uncharacterized protein n=1 Tax=Senna tora TaxID=362788 RepID=A0A834U334_9FABA|nr:uncharacterized protein G2W53_020363 [Senna tora]